MVEGTYHQAEAASTIQAPDHGRTWRQGRRARTRNTSDQVGRAKDNTVRVRVSNRSQSNPHVGRVTPIRRAMCSRKLHARARTGLHQRTILHCNNIELATPTVPEHEAARTQEEQVQGSIAQSPRNVWSHTTTTATAGAAAAPQARRYTAAASIARRVAERLAAMQLQKRCGEQERRRRGNSERTT